MLSIVLPSTDAGRLSRNANGTRLKELVSLEGVRDNQLIGYGLVVGLNGTGDHRQTLFPAQSLTNLLQQMGVSVDPTAIPCREHRGGHGHRDSAAFRAAGHAHRRHGGCDRRCYQSAGRSAACSPA